jgi:hypothetical protein
MTRRLPPLLLALLLWHEAEAQKPDSFLRPNDIIAIIGGEDMLAADEYGYLEYLLQRALPDYRLKIRCLAWEGDTVFKQPRMLNYPGLDHQLDEMHATAVIMQFGRMESLDSPRNLGTFNAALGKLLGVVTRTDQRRLAIITPTPSKGASGDEYSKAIETLPFGAIVNLAADGGRLTLRDGVHLNEAGQVVLAEMTAKQLLPNSVRAPKTPEESNAKETKLLGLIRAKNRLWNNYRRPQNWAFLAGDRTEQPSSRDYRDSSKRWFPEEMKQWLPLIEAKENEIWALAAEFAGK